MKLKLLQLNIWKGTYMQAVVDFVRKETFDVLTFQEVTSGIASADKKSNIFALLMDELAMKGIESVNFRFVEDPESSFANAILYRKPYVLQNKKEIQLTKPISLSYTNSDWTKAPRTALCATLTKNGESITIVTTHGAWSPIAEDTKEKIRQGALLFQYLKTIPSPFVVTGDFNAVAETKMMKTYEALTTNLTKTYNVQNTLNPNVHYAKQLFPKGLAVDHILVTPTITVRSFRIIDTPNLSDHLGIAVELET